MSLVQIQRIKLDSDVFFMFRKCYVLHLFSQQMFLSKANAIFLTSPVCLFYFPALFLIAMVIPCVLFNSKTWNRAFIMICHYFIINFKLSYWFITLFNKRSYSKDSKNIFSKWKSMSKVRHFWNVACKNYEVWTRMLGLFINTKFNCT